MTLEELGRILRQERERRGLSAEEVASRLKLTPRVVRAIEQADIVVLPQAAYARGFVKSYGNLLELEADLLHAGIEDGWPCDLHTPAVSQEFVEKKGNNGKTRLTLLVSLVLILGAAGALWSFRDLDLPLPSGGLLTAEPAISTKNEVPNLSTQAKAIPQLENKSQTTTGSPVPLAAAPAAPRQSDSPSVSADNRSMDKEKIPATLPRAAPSPAASSAAQQDAPHQLIVIALAECWVESNADDSNTREFSLRKGDTFALTFSTKLALKIGNAGGVRLRLDGREMEAPGEAGQVKLLSFPSTP